MKHWRKQDHGLKFPGVTSPVPGTKHREGCDLIIPTHSEVKEHSDYIRTPPGQGTSNKPKLGRQVGRKEKQDHGLPKHGALLRWLSAWMEAWFGRGWMGEEGHIRK